MFPEKYFLDENLSHLGIDRKKLVWIALLCGTDFNRGVYGIGAKKGLKLVKETESFEEIEHKLGEEVHRWQEIENVFLHPDVFDPVPESLRRSELRKDELSSFMCEEHSFSRERVESALQRAFHVPEDAGQSALGKWM